MVIYYICILIYLFLFITNKLYYILIGSVKSESDNEFYSIEDENSDTEMKSVIDDEIETMSIISTTTDVPIEADKYDLQFDLNEEEKMHAKIKGLN